MTTVERLDARLRGYHGQDLTAVLDVLDYLIDVDGDEATVIAGGSLSIEQGNRESDLDVVIVAEGVPSSAVPVEHWVGSLRIDAWTRTPADVEALFVRAEAALAADSPIRGAFGDVVQEQELKLLHRIAFGVVVRGSTVRPEASPDVSSTALRLLSREYTERARESVTVAALALAAGRDLLAATVARVGVEEALHAQLHGRGVPFSGDKWLSEQLREQPDLAAVHAQVAVLPSRGEPLTAYTEAALESAHRLLGVPPEAVLAGLCWTFAGLRVLPLAGGHLLVCVAHGAAWHLEEAEAAVWQALCGGAERGGFPHPADAAGAALCVRWYEAGLLAPDWDRGLRPVAWAPVA